MTFDDLRAMGLLDPLAASQPVAEEGSGSRSRNPAEPHTLSDRAAHGPTSDPDPDAVYAAPVAGGLDVELLTQAMENTKQMGHDGVHSMVPLVAYYSPILIAREYAALAAGQPVFGTPTPPLGANIYITHCIHGLDLRIYPRCYLCRPVLDAAPGLPHSIEVGSVAGSPKLPHAYNVRADE